MRPLNSIERADASSCAYCGGDIGYFSPDAALCGLCAAAQDFDHDTDPCLYTYSEEDCNADDGE